VFAEPDEEEERRRIAIPLKGLPGEMASTQPFSFLPKTPILGLWVTCNG
jgi:hypothetical protein